MSGAGLARTAITDEHRAPADGCVVWHRRNLRTHDHAALAYAAATYDTVLPAFVFDPQFYGADGLACDARIAFLHDCLEDLREQYAEAGGDLTLLHGDPVERLSDLVDRGWDVVATADPTGRYGHERDNEAAAQCDVTFVDGDGLVRDRENTRDGWADAVEEWFEGELHSWDPDSITLEHIETEVTRGAIEDRYDVVPEKTRVPVGGRDVALKRLRRFTDLLPEYPGNISAPTDAKMGTSRLSPYLRFGCLSVREVYQHVTREGPDCRGTEMFVSRLYWNRHYNQKLEDWHGWTDDAVNPAMEDFHADTYDPEHIAAWKEGRTGYPMVDASMRCLRETGWLNFRMRAMCASVLCDLLQQPWRIGADWFYYHLIDADPAINYTQFQHQAGVVGVDMLRVYNPRKQVTDNDPEGEFICEWVPELEPLPVTHLARPEKTPLHVQEECGVEIGADYPYPIVEYEQARQEGMVKLEQAKPEAEDALTDPEVARRASFSRGGFTSQSTDEPSSAETQASLTDF